MVSNATPDRAFGIDIGGSGIKGAVVDTHDRQARDRTQALSRPRSRPRRTRWPRSWPSWCPRRTGPGRSARRSRLSSSTAWPARRPTSTRVWIGTDVDEAFTNAVGHGSQVVVLNDADAAGIAEARFGAAKGVDGVVIMLTFGTGIGSALLIERRTRAEHRARPPRARRLRRRDARGGLGARRDTGCPTRQWAQRVNHYMLHVERLFTPDLFVVGGGVSKEAEKWVPLLELNTPVVPGPTAQRRRHRRRGDGCGREPRRVAAARGCGGRPAPDSSTMSASGNCARIWTRFLSRQTDGLRPVHARPAARGAAYRVQTIVRSRVKGHS